ncbi:hypothetical protein EsDP_00002855 [Epichloe bromicola]|uniref:Negative acting factor n=2 Tax=Epichloe bromicola TaxID=79588 RepID=A0ABQ0CM32_9HYPO
MLPNSYSTTPSPSTLPSSSTAHTVTASSNYNSPVAANSTTTIKTEPGFPPAAKAAATIKIEPGFPPAANAATTVKAEAGFDFSAPIDPSSRHLPAPNSHSQEFAKTFDYKNILTTAADPGSKKMKITEIIDLLGPPPPQQQISHTEDTFNEITKVYHEMYAGGLSAFLETTWYYFVENGKMSFPKDANLIEHMATFLKILEAVKANDHSQMAYSGVLETRIVWELACTAYQTPDRTNQAMRAAMPPDGDAAEARNRLRVVETLLCGEYLLSNPLALPLSDADLHRTRQFDFWYSLAEFIRRRDHPDSPPAVQAREDALSRMRHLLDGRENRDVLYSIAVVRELAPRYGPSYGSRPQHLDESDPKNRLAVASKFILDEAQVTGGTTNVVRRFSDIASRAFVNPAVNVFRRTC